MAARAAHRTSTTATLTTRRAASRAHTRSSRSSASITVTTSASSCAAPCCTTTWSKTTRPREPRFRTAQRTSRASTCGCSTPSSMGAGTWAATAPIIHGRWDLSGHQLHVRLGNQVVNRGESTFIQGGINAAINHFDVAALRVPGAELREAYLPQEMAKVSFGLTDNLTAEGIALFDWDPTQPEPVGTYFSSNDFVPRGGHRVFLGFGAFSDQGTDFTSLGGPFIENFQAVPREPTTVPSDSGQYGLSLRWFLPDFAQGTELGFYYVNYHSKLPVISGRAGTAAGICKSMARSSRRARRRSASPPGCR